MLLSDLIARYDARNIAYYRGRDGRPSREHLNIRAATRRLLAHCGPNAEAERFTRHALRAWRDQLAEERLTRRYVNACVGRVRAMFRWAADVDFAPASIASDLALVGPLAPFRSGAREGEPRPTITSAEAEAIMGRLPQWAREVCQILSLTAARPGEIAEITSGEVHLLDGPGYLEPMSHKGAHKGRSKIIPLCPRAHAIIAARWKPLAPGDPLWWTRRGPATSEALTKAWSRARQAAGMPQFQVYDLRRAGARVVRAELGLDAAQALLGHASSRTTEIYCGLDRHGGIGLPLAERAVAALERKGNTT